MLISIRNTFTGTFGIQLDPAGHMWFIPVILATQEAEIRRITVQSQSRQIVLRKTAHKNRAGVGEK
jgi:hypothetical protein